jgi:alpha-L-rhamnosidase
MKNRLFAVPGPLVVSVALLSATLFFFGCKAVSNPSGIDGIRVSNLLCETIDNPQGIDAVNPRLSWSLESDQRGQKQTAWRLIVASSAGVLQKNTGDLWDSGIVKAEDQSIRYNGKPLESLKQYFWKVMVWDKTGQPSSWSEPKHFAMGMLDASGWKAEWIGATEKSAMAGMGKGFRSKTEKRADAAKWVQVDLGEVEPIDRILLYTVKFFHDSVPYYTPDHGFPLRFYIEVADNPEMRNAVRVSDHTEADFYPLGWPHCRVPVKPEEGVLGRYIRITATKLRHEGDGDYWFGLAEIQVFSPTGRNLADGAPVTASDSREAGEWSVKNLTKYFKTEESAALLLRKKVVLNKKPVRAIACMSGLGMSELYINGQKADDHKLDPADTDYRKRVMYVTYDLTKSIGKGENVIGVILGNGWYDINFRDIWDFEGSTWAASKKLLLQIELEFSDGSKKTIVSDGSWKWSTGEIVYNSLRGGETIDAGKAQPGWNLPGFDDSSWKPAIRLNAPEGRLESQLHVPNREIKEVRPVRILEPAPGIYIYDMGQNFSGWVKFRASGEKGRIVQLNFAEQLNDKGMIDQDHWSSSYIYGRYQTGELILSGMEKDLFEPRFTYFGFQYVQVEGLSAKPALDDMVGVMVHVSPGVKGSFACSSEKFNRLHSVINHSLLNYTHHRPRDPARERLGWTQDVWQIAEPSFYNYDLGTVFRLWFRDMKAGQEASGHVPPVNPAPVWGNWGQNGSNLSCPWWGGAMHYGPWQLYQFNGDLELLRELYPGMKASLDFIHSTSKELIIDWGLGDWGDVGSIDIPVNTPRNFSNTCAFYYLATICTQIAETLGETEDYLKYDKLANDILQAFNKKFLDTNTGSYGENSQTKYALPLLLGMVPDEMKDIAGQRLIGEVKKKNGHLSTGFVGTMALMKVLSDLNPEVAYEIASQEEQPGWWGMIKDGRSTIPEFWSGEGVQNIVSLGGPLENWFYYGLAGIRPDPSGPGFKKFILKPAFVKELDWLKAHHDSPYGRISVDWERRENKIQFRFTVPVGSTATVYIPAIAQHNGQHPEILEGGEPVQDSSLFRLVRREKNDYVYEAGSGAYHVSVLFDNE